MPKKHRQETFVMNIPYSREQHSRLKSFCAMLPISMARFTAEALDNEIDARIDAMPKEKQEAVKQLLNGFLPNPQ